MCALWGDSDVIQTGGTEASKNGCCSSGHSVTRKTTESLHFGLAFVSFHSCGFSAPRYGESAGPRGPTEDGGGVSDHDGVVVANMHFPNTCAFFNSVQSPSTLKGKYHFFVSPLT